MTFIWINHSYILTDDEELLIKYSTLSKNFIVNAQEKPDPKKYLFVNISWEKELMDLKGELDMPIGKIPITSRNRLADLFKIFNENQNHKFIILDVWFVDSSDYKSDSTLQAQFYKAKNFLIPYHKNPEDDNKKLMPIFNAPTALSDYEKDDFESNFSKFRLVQGDHFKTTPLVMYEKLHNETYSEEGFWNYLGDKLSLNSFILDLKIWNYDIKLKQDTSLTALLDSTAKAKYSYYQLAEILPIGFVNLPPSIKDQAISEQAKIWKDITKDRIIVIGDFEDQDIHETLYGATPGPLILLNVFLALEAGDNIINWWFVLFLFLAYCVISYICFSNTDLIDKYILSKLLPPSRFRTLIMGFIDYIIYFGLLSVISYFLFNVHLTILLLAVLMKGLEEILTWLRKRSERKLQNVFA